MKYTLSFTINPSFVILSSKNQFVYLEMRIGQVDDFIKNAAIKHIEYLESTKEDEKLNGYLQLRRLFFDDKSGTFSAVVDYLTDNSFESKPTLSIDEELWIMEGQPTYVNFKIIDCFFGSDHFDKNHRNYYSTERVIPWISDFDNYILQRNLKDVKNNRT